MSDEMENISREWLESFESYQNWFISLKLSSSKNEVSDNMKKQYESVLRNFIRFRRAGGDQKATPDSIIKMVREMVDAKEGKQVIVMLNNFSLWMQGKEVEGHDKRIPYRGRFAIQSSADGLAHGGFRGFLTHNEIQLPKSPRRKKSTRTKVKKNDEKYPIFKPGKNGKEVADYDIFRQFLSTLNIHDQTILISMLSTSQDPADVLKLNIGFVVNQEGDRLYWEGERTKTGESFRTFFSEEATKMVRRYVKQERKGAGEGDPLFSRKKGQRIKPINLSQNCKNVSRKMGMINGDTQNPFRPKRMRSIFRSACSIAGIEKGYSNVFMGHKTDVSDSYLEKPRSTLEIRYLMVEPYLKVFAGDMGHEIVEMKEKVDEYSERQEETNNLVVKVMAENIELRQEVKDLSELVDGFRKYSEMLESQYQLFESRSGPEEGEEIQKVDMNPDQKEYRKRMIKMNVEDEN